ncbi:MAG: GNAT family N-acetyltransferase [Deltaproteobacteria bacterium]|nr:GNAT family N-acetyltransferase [Deltaproteobacteria bacterium]
MAPPFIKIRRCQQGDLSAVAAIEARFFSKSSLLPLFSFIQYFDLFSDLFFVAISKGKVVGFVVGGLISADQSQGWLLDIAVAKNLHRRGVGEKLCRNLFQRFKQLRVKKVYATCSPSNNASQGLLGQFGFRKSRSIQNYFGPKEHRLLLVCKFRNRN